MNLKSDDNHAAMQVAMRLLARREHSEWEMRTKLKSRGYDLQITDQVIEDLQARQILSELRYVDSYVRARTARGMGPLKIMAELRARGISDKELTDIESNASHWLENIRQLWHKRYQDNPVNDQKELSRRWRFFQSRGFTDEQIHTVLDRVW